MAPPSTSSCRCPRAPSSSSRSGSGPERSRHGWTFAPAGAVPSTTRTGSPRGAGASRTVRAGIVGPHRARPDQHGVALGPQRVGVGTGLGPGDPPARTVRCGGAPVERCSQLEHDERSTGPTVPEVRGQRDLRGRLLHADLDLDARGPQPGDPRAGHLRVGILEGHHDPAHARGDERVGARRGAPVVRTRLEGDPGGRPVQVDAGRRGRGEGDRLRVRTPDRLRGALVERAVGCLDDAARPMGSGGWPTAPPRPPRGPGSCAGGRGRRSWASHRSQGVRKLERVLILSGPVTDHHQPRRGPAGAGRTCRRCRRPGAGGGRPDQRAARAPGAPDRG